MQFSSPQNFLSSNSIISNQIIIAIFNQNYFYCFISHKIFSQMSGYHTQPTGPKTAAATAHTESAAENVQTTV
jgi:hypothetical protein